MSSFDIPSKAIVGFDEREDTFTDALGFVTYRDHLGKLKQENAWEGWRDESQEPLEFDNVPTFGFILNKNGGGVNSGWGHYDRMEFFRVWDPRGFEVEITTDNLLKIIAFNGISKDNGIEGELVYAWKVGAKKITLLPVTSKDYTNQVKKDADLSNKKLFDKADLLPGTLYMFKNQMVLTYLGRFKEIFTLNWNNEIQIRKNGFVFTDGTKYLFQSNINHLTHTLEVDTEFAQKLWAYEQTYFNIGGKITEGFGPIEESGFETLEHPFYLHEDKYYQKIECWDDSIRMDELIPNDPDERGACIEYKENPILVDAILDANKLMCMYFTYGERKVFFPADYYGDRVRYHLKDLYAEKYTDFPSIDNEDED